jgi:hypothetical protein
MFELNALTLSARKGISVNLQTPIESRTSLVNGAQWALIARATPTPLFLTHFQVTKLEGLSTSTILPIYICCTLIHLYRYKLFLRKTV